MAPLALKNNFYVYVYDVSLLNVRRSACVYLSRRISCENHFFSQEPCRNLHRMRINIWKNMTGNPKRLFEAFQALRGEPMMLSAKEARELKELDDAIPLAEAHDFWDFPNKEPTQGQWFRWRKYKEYGWDIWFHG